MPDQDHHIRSIVFDINSDVSDEFLSQDYDLQDFFLEKVIEEIGQTLNTVINPLETIYVDSLVIDVGVIPIKDWKSRFLSNLQEEMAKSLPDKIETARKGADEHISFSLYNLVLTFLQKSSFPWWFEIDNWTSFEEELSSTFSVKEVVELIHALKVNKTHRARFLQSFSENVIVKLIAKTQSVSVFQEIKNKLEFYLQSRNVKLSSNKEFSKWFWESILKSIKIQHTSVSWVPQVWIRTIVEGRRHFYFTSGQIIQGKAKKQLFERLLIDFVTENFPGEMGNSIQSQEVPGEKTKTYSEEIPDGNFPGPMKDKTGKLSDEETEKKVEGNQRKQKPEQGIFGENKKAESISDIEKKRSFDISGKEPAGEFNAEPELPEPAVEPNQGRTGKDKTGSTFRKPTPADEDYEFVHHAGIVLLHPFLPNFFNACKQLKNDQWISEEHKVKAVQLLAYLSTGSQFCPEHEMSLFKFLIGLEKEVLVSPELEISQELIDESDTMLKAVIENWNALKSSSIDTVREGFLQREGKLQPDDMGWKLFVGQKTVDILLSRLPWGLGIVKFPWLDSILRVEWT